MLCRLKKNRIHKKPDGTDMRVGEQINLTESQYEAFKDRFEPVEVFDDVELKEEVVFAIAFDDNKFGVFDADTGKSKTDPGIFLTQDEVLKHWPTIQFFTIDECPYEYEWKEEPKPIVKKKVIKKKAK